MNKATINRIVLQEMKSIYFDKNKPYTDWMGYRITEDNKPSYHHIEKRETLKKENKSIAATVENGAYLGKHSHELLHRIELVDLELYEAWNYLFLLINKMGCYPIDDVWTMVESLKEKSESLLSQDDRVLKRLKKEVAKSKM